jgi:hypothetical protein
LGYDRDRLLVSELDYGRNLCCVSGFDDDLRWVGLEWALID